MERFPSNSHPYEDLRTAQAAAATNKVLTNTYLLLSATLAFSALTAGLGMAFDMPRIHPIITLVVYFGLFFAVVKTRESSMGLVSIFALTGFLGLTLGPIISMYLRVLPIAGRWWATRLASPRQRFWGWSAYCVEKPGATSASCAASCFVGGGGGRSWLRVGGGFFFQPGQALFPGWWSRDVSGIPIFRNVPVTNP